MQGTVNTEDNIILYVVIGASFVLIFLFAFFVLQNIKSISDSLSSSNTEDSQNAKSPDQESGY
jgi:uncharacterized integral membrane protein